MSDLIEVNLSYINSKGKKISYPIQGQFFKIVLEVKNISENTITGFSPASGQFGNSLGHGLAHSISFVSDGKYQIAPNETKTYLSNEFRTFYRNLCALNIHLSSHNSISAFLTTPLEENMAQTKTNQIYAQCFVQDKDEIINKRLAHSNTILSFVSCFVSIVALYVSLAK